MNIGTKTAHFLNRETGRIHKIDNVTKIEQNGSRYEVHKQSLYLKSIHSLLIGKYDLVRMTDTYCR